MIIEVFVGDTGEYLHKIAQNNNNTAIMISSKNCKHLLPGTYFTSLGDLDNLDQLYCILEQANIIRYVPPQKWTNNDLKFWTEEYVKMFLYNSKKQIYGLDRPVPDNDITAINCLPDHRKSDSPQIWIAGCSISHGIGVTPHQRYGYLIANDLNLPVSFLTASGASNRWISDQIIRSDIRQQDIVFFGITSPGRLSYWDPQEQRIQFAVPEKFSMHRYLKTLVNEKFLASEHLIYESVISIHNVLNFCNKVNAKVVVGTLIQGIETYFADCYNFVHIAGTHSKQHKTKFLDVGNDNRHPGPMSHHFFKEKFLEKFREIYQ